MRRIRIVIADDHPVVRSGLEAMLGTQADFEVVGLSADGRQAIERVEEVRPDVLLLDLRMPGGGGMDVLHSLRSHPETRVLVLTTYETDADILPALEAGAAGYLLKDVPREELFLGVREVVKGRRVLSSSVERRLAERMRERRAHLSARELEVLGLLASGASNRAIAKRLFVSEATVKTHLIHVFEKLGASDRTAAVTIALRRGILRLGDD